MGIETVQVLGCLGSPDWLLEESFRPFVDDASLEPHRNFGI